MENMQAGKSCSCGGRAMRVFVSDSPPVASYPRTTGHHVEAAQYRDYMTLVSNKIPEAFDLEFKAELYGNTDPAKRALAGDVAALANTAGGLLIVGIEEDGQARASAAPGVSVADAEVTRIRQTVASNVVPFPPLDVLQIEDPAHPGDGLMVIAVARSPLAPHAVLVNEGLRYPRRNGATIRYLSEPEVATAYRERFASTNSQVARAEQVGYEALMRLLTRDRKCWVVVSACPDLPGEFLVDQAALRTIRSELLGKRPTIMPTSLSWMRVSVGRRRLILDDSNDNLMANYLAAELHHDGAGSFAMNAQDVGYEQYGVDVSQQERVLNDEQAVNAILSGLSFLASQARDRASAGGNALVRVTIHPTTQDPVYLGTGRRSRFPTRSQQLKVPVVPAESAAPLDALVTPGPGLIATGYLLATELFQEFGLPECGQLTRDGQLRIQYWSQPLQQPIQQWATSAGITVSNETLPT